MGRLQPSARMTFQDYLNRMRTQYKEALLSDGRRRAFDRLVEACSSELGAMSYAESMTMMDLILLTGAVDNRAFTESLKAKLDSLEARLNEVQKTKN